MGRQILALQDALVACWRVMTDEQRFSPEVLAAWPDRFLTEDEVMNDGGA